jgi:uncharacterized repeat protein (TIGR03803 family)
MVVLALAVVVLPGAIGGNLAEAQTLTVLYTFTGGIDGGNPVGAVIRDAEGNLYRTTCCDGAYGAGTVFMLDNAGNEKVLYSFTGGADGDQPYASLIRDENGTFTALLSGEVDQRPATEASGAESSLSWIQVVKKRCAMPSRAPEGTA